MAKPVPREPRKGVSAAAAAVLNGLTRAARTKFFSRRRRHCTVIRQKNSEEEMLFPILKKAGSLVGTNLGGTAGGKLLSLFFSRILLKDKDKGFFYGLK